MKDLIPALIWIVVLVVAIGFTLYKKKSQLGKTWEGPVGAIVTIKDKELKCSHCSNNLFAKIEGLITTTWVTLFRFPFWNRSAACFVCKECGAVHWFVKPKEKA